ncbi:MAG: hypothetical protein ACREC6_02235 [Hyphomicrobiaceae bacterium]
MKSLQNLNADIALRLTLSPSFLGIKAENNSVVNRDWGTFLQVSPTVGDESEGGGGGDGGDGRELDANGWKLLDMAMTIGKILDFRFLDKRRRRRGGHRCHESIMNAPMRPYTVGADCLANRRALERTA